MALAHPPGQGFVRKGRCLHVLHRYSMRGFTLGRPVKVCVCSSEGAGTGSRMTPTFAPPDVTAQLGSLMTKGAGHAHTCPSRVGCRVGEYRGGWATSQGEKPWHCEGQMWVGFLCRRDRKTAEVWEPPRVYHPLVF